MRWRQAFMTEVFGALQQLGLRACPVCYSAESLRMSPFPVILVDGDFAAEADAGFPEGEHGDLTLAVRVECRTCGHLLLFNAQRFRTVDEKILQAGVATN
jgi:hypothetical protein